MPFILSQSYLPWLRSRNLANVVGGRKRAIYIYIYIYTWLRLPFLIFFFFFFVLKVS